LIDVVIAPARNTVRTGMDVSVIIVNWNSAAYTTACVASIRTATQGLHYEIVVVDNASSDNSVEMLRQVPDIRVVISSTNLGFGRANNLGYQQSSGGVLLFLNPDTSVQGEAIYRMYTALLSSPNLGIVGCKLLNSDFSLQTSCIQAFPTILNQLTDVEALKIRFPRVRMWGISALFQEQLRLIPVDVVSGACLMIGRGIFDEVGLFDADYFMYCEDVDLCHRVAQAGLQVGYVADATVIHYGGQSSKQARNSFFGDVVAREAIRTFFVKTRGMPYARAYSCSVCLAAMLRLLLLSLVPPSLLGKDRHGASATRQKWRKILRWSLGRERWAKHLGNSTVVTPEPRTAEVA